MRGWIAVATGLAAIACGGGPEIDDGPCGFPGPTPYSDPKWAAYPIPSAGFDICASQADRVIYATRGDHFSELKEKWLADMIQLGWAQELPFPSGYDPDYWTTNLTNGSERIELRVFRTQSGESTSVGLYVL